MPMRTATTQIETVDLVPAAILVTGPDQAPALQWIVDTSLLGEELTAFHQEAIRGRGNLVQHEPVRGAPKGYTELRVPIAQVPADVMARLPRRIRAAITLLGQPD